MFRSGPRRRWCCELRSSLTPGIILPQCQTALSSPPSPAAVKVRAECWPPRLGWGPAVRGPSVLTFVGEGAVIVPSRRYSVLLSSGEAPQLCWAVEVGSVGDRPRSLRCRWGPLISTCYLISLPPGYSRWSWSLRRSPAACSVTLEQPVRPPLQCKSLSRAPGEDPGRPASWAPPRGFSLCPREAQLWMPQGRSESQDLSRLSELLREGRGP